MTEMERLEVLLEKAGIRMEKFPHWDYGKSFPILWISAESLGLEFGKFDFSVCCDPDSEGGFFGLLEVHTVAFHPAIISSYTQGFCTGLEAYLKIRHVAAEYVRAVEEEGKK